MKKITLLLTLAVCAFTAQAQNISPDNDYVPGKMGMEKTCNSLPTGWCIDANLTGGFLTQEIKANSMAAGYLNTVNTNVSDIGFKNGGSMGIDVQGGYFFGPKRHFGVGAGIMYLHQTGDLTVDHFHVEYQSLDKYGNTFRQVLTSNGQLKESIHTSSLNIPVVFKYKTEFTHRIGFTGDAGLLLNVLEHNEYKAKSSFDYEAIYKYVGGEGNVTTVYDASPTPAASDLIITKNKYQYLNSSTAVQQYFNTLRSQGYNVGLGVTPDNRKGSVNYTVPSVGLLVHPALNIWLCNNFSMNVGVYYIYQYFTNNAAANYMVTDKVGSYNSVMNNVTSTSTSNVGLDLGVRYCFSKPKAETPPAPAPEPEETQVAPAEEMPAASPVSEDEMPVEANISTPILFDLNKTEIKSQYYPILDEAVKEMTASNKSTLVIHGYTDNTGAANYNRALSRKRAVAVKNYLHKKGVKSRMMKTVGHGSKNPAASNATREGRAMNRRVEMKLKDRSEE